MKFRHTVIRALAPIVGIVGCLVAANAGASGLAVSVPVVGRLVGSGNVLFATAIDVTNCAQVRTPVRYYFSGVDSVTHENIYVVGSIGDAGVVPLNAGSMAGQSSQHFEDFIDALVAAGRLPKTVETDGILGSVLFVFDSATKRGAATVSARFYNAFGGGLVGVSIKGHEIQMNEPTKLIATLRDTGGSGESMVTYPNLFINNTGLAPDGSPAAGPITIQVSAVSGKTGQPVGNAVTYTMKSGETINVGHTFQALGIDNTKDDLVIVTAAVTSGNSAIEGIVSQVDAVTRDGSAFEMSGLDL